MDSPGRRRLTTLSNKFLSAVTRFSTWFKSCVEKSREGLYFLDGPSCEQHPKSMLLGSMSLQFGLSAWELVDAQREAYSTDLAWPWHGRRWHHTTVVVPDPNLPGKSQSEVKTPESQHLPPKSESHLQKPSYFCG